MALPNLDNVPDIQLISDGEHELEIVRAREATSKKGEDYLKVTFNCLDEDNTEDFSSVIMYPVGNNDKNDSKRKQRLNSFMNAFDLSEGMEPEDMEGRTGRAIVRTKEAYSGDGEENDIRAFC